MDYDKLARDYEYLASAGTGSTDGWRWALTRGTEARNLEIKSTGWAWFPAVADAAVEAVTLEHDGARASARVAPLSAVAPRGWDLSPAAGTNTYLIGDVQGPPELVDAVLYLAARRARIHGAKCVALALDAHAPATLAPLKLGRLSLEPADAPDHVMHAGLLDVFMSRTSRALPGPVFSALAVAEVGETAEAWIQHTLDHAHAFRRFKDGSLKKTQYIYMLAQMHQFVRWTTRILGRCVGHAHDATVRRHFLDHLRGEVDHEVIIEKDLAQLGYDTDFLVNEMAPNVPTHEFMVAQEAMIGFHADPILLLGSPTAAEGLASHQNAATLAEYEACIASWGVAQPRRAMKFVSSHVQTDGGDDGHWEEGIRALGQDLPNEARLQRFLCMTRTSMAALSRAYDSYVDDVAIFEFEA